MVPNLRLFSLINFGEKLLPIGQQIFQVGLNLVRFNCYVCLEFKRVRK